MSLVLNHEPYNHLVQTPLKDLRILVTNDDGVHAHGIGILERAARSLSDDVWVVAPLLEQSGAGHSLTINNPLRLERLSETRYAVTGTPTDCVLLAVKSIFAGQKKPDLVLSGINRGSNLAEDITYSGTIAAAMEGTLLDIPSIAFSQSTYAHDDTPWPVAEAHVAGVITKLASIGWPPNVLMNVNFPPCAPEAVKGIRPCPHGRRAIGDKLVSNKDPKGRTYFWIGGDRWDQTDWRGCDIDQINDGYISVTPISMDLTDYKCLEALREGFDL
jgi:5'-nucleotidase